MLAVAGNRGFCVCEAAEGGPRRLAARVPENEKLDILGALDEISAGSSGCRVAGIWPATLKAHPPELKT